MGRGNRLNQLTEVMSITAAQISKYLETNAFASSRTSSAYKSSRSDSVTTSDVANTLSLLSGTSDTLSSVQTNLTEMLKIAKAITTSSTDSDREKAYAELRSLSAGIDDIVSSDKYSKNVLLDGTTLSLSGAGSYSKTVLDDLLSTSSDMGLADNSDGASVNISYDSFCTWNNAKVGLEGLTITSASYDKVKIAQNELKDGSDYTVQVDYLGSDSTVRIMDNKGNMLSEADDVDLSGSGVTDVDFDCGVSLTFEKTENSALGYDKYDTSDKGAAVLYADLSYSRLNTYELEGSSTTSDRSATINYAQQASTDSDGGTFSIASMGLGALTDSSGNAVNELSTGTYTIEVNKIGDTAAATMYDKSGKIVGSVSDVKLAADGTTSLDFGNGAVVSVNDSDFTGNTTLKAVVKYNQATTAYDDFDFSTYAKQIESAIKTVTKEQSVVSSANTIANTVNEAIKGTLQDNVFSTTGLLITNLLGGDTSSTSATSLIGASSTDTSTLSYTNNLILKNLSKSLGVDSDSGTSLSSLLNGTTTAISPYKLSKSLKVSG
jgi:hypothetical protein